MARIVLLASYAPSLVNFRGHLIGELVKAGHEVIAAAPEGADSTGAAEKVAGLGARFEPVPLQNAGLNPLAERRTLRWLTRWFKELHPDLVLSYTIKPVIWGSLAARKAGVKEIAAIITGLGYAFAGGSFKQNVVGCVARFLYRRALSNTSRVFFQNPDDRRLFVEQRLVSAEKTLVVNGSGVDLDHYRAGDAPVSPVVFLMCARLLRDKGVFEYLEAARDVKRTHPEAVFRLLGPYFDNPMAIQPQELQPFIADGTVDYCGDAEDVRPHFAAASVFVLPSYREGTPRTVLEAMSMCRAVITTDVPGCRETVIEGDNGFLVAARDSVGLAEKMRKFLADPGLITSMGGRSRDIAEQRYDVRLVTSAILAGLKTV